VKQEEEAKKAANSKKKYHYYHCQVHDKRRGQEFLEWDVDASHYRCTEGNTCQTGGNAFTESGQDAKSVIDPAADSPGTPTPPDIPPPISLEGRIARLAGNKESSPPKDEAPKIDAPPPAFTEIKKERPKRTRRKKRTSPSKPANRKEKNKEVEEGKGARRSLSWAFTRHVAPILE
jgi:hypothetical protein